MEQTHGWLSIVVQFAFILYDADYYDVETDLYDTANELSKRVDNLSEQHLKM